MPLKDKIAALVSAAPVDATVTVGWLAELLAADSASPLVDPVVAAPGAVVDLTVAQCAAHLGKGASTVRTWLVRGELPGAYRMHGREWRIPLSAIQAMQTAQARQHRARAKAAPAVADGRMVDLGAWRQHVPKAERA